MFFRYAAILFTICIGCASPNKTSTATDTLAATSLAAYGRSAISTNRLELIGSAVHFSFSFEGKEVGIFASLSGGQDHNYLQYEMDGVYQKRLRLSKENQQPLIISADNDGTHTVTIYKATEAHTGPVFIEKITGRNVKSVAPEKTPLIEFIGNSITCGAAADPSEVPCGTGLYHDQHNAYLAYGPRVARTLKANFLLSSVSGYGVYRNWNSNGPALPLVYEKTDLQAGSQRQWNFAAYSPAVVSIALGTNDMSNGDGKTARLPFDSASFVRAYINFVQSVKAKYPVARIALLSSPMMTGDRREQLQRCLLAVKAAIDLQHSSAKPVACYFFKPMQARGCTGHPNVDDQRLMAEELTSFFEQLLR